MKKKFILIASAIGIGAFTLGIVLDSTIFNRKKFDGYINVVNDPETGAQELYLQITSEKDFENIAKSDHVTFKVRQINIKPPKKESPEKKIPNA